MSCVCATFVLVEAIQFSESGFLQSFFLMKASCFTGSFAFCECFSFNESLYLDKVGGFSKNHPKYHRNIFLLDLYF